MPVRYDETQWPLVIITMPPEELSPGEFTNHLDRISSYYTKGEPFGMVVDTRGAAPLNAAYRRSLAERIELDGQRYPGIAHAAAIVMTSSVQRGILMAITWLLPKRIPMEPFGEIDEATSWVRSRLGLATRKIHRAS